MLLLLFACTGADKPPGETGSPPPTGGFALGVEYTQLGLAEAYAPTGVGWAKTRLEVFEWGASEPAAPVGGRHTYDWSCTDAHVLAWQEAGILQVQSYLSPKSAWGSVDAAGAVVGDIAPAAAHVEDLRAWVGALVERYDGDGVDDAPGLRAPVHHWVIGPEWTGFWPSGDADAYIAFAEVAVEAARAADADVVVGAMPMLFADEFVGNEPTDAEIEARMGAPYTLRNDNTGIEAMLDRPDLFDAYDVHALGDYTELPPLLRWLRAQMESRGYSRPIWLDDAFPAGILANGAGFPANYPVTDATYADAYDLLRAVAREETVGRFAPDDAAAWVQAYYGAHTVKKVATALGEGAAGIMLGNTEDWFYDAGAPSVRDATVFLIGGAATMGMIDVTHGGAYDVCDTRTAGGPRPAWTNLGLLAPVIAALPPDTVERLGEAEGARGYRFESAGEPWWVLWSEDGALHLPGDAAESPTEMTVVLPEGVDAVDVTTAVTRAGEPTTERVTATDGAVTLPLTSTPVIVRVAR